MAGGGGLLSEQHGGGAFDPLPPAGTSRADQATWADKQLALLCARYKERWGIWYVPMHPHGYLWCARPAGSRLATISVGTPENLAAEIWRHEESPARGRDFSDLSTGELKRVHRDLTVSAALAVPSSGAYLMVVTQMQAIDAELAVRRQAAAAQSEGDLLWNGQPVACSPWMWRPR
jgi:hypothetical protein